MVRYVKKQNERNAKRGFYLTEIGENEYASPGGAEKIEIAIPNQIHAVKTLA